MEFQFKNRLTEFIANQKKKKNACINCKLKNYAKFDF